MVFSCVNCLNRTDPEQKDKLHCMILMNIQKSYHIHLILLNGMISPDGYPAKFHSISTHFDSIFIQGIPCDISFCSMTTKSTL